MERTGQRPPHRLSLETSTMPSNLPSDGDLALTFPVGRALEGTLLRALHGVPEPVLGQGGGAGWGRGDFTRGPPPASPPASPASKASPPQAELTASEFQALQGPAQRASLVCQTGMENTLSRP